MGAPSVLSSEQDKRWFGARGGREEVTDIGVAGDDHSAFCPGAFEDLAVG